MSDSIGRGAATNIEIIPQPRGQPVALGVRIERRQQWIKQNFIERGNNEG